MLNQQANGHILSQDRQRVPVLPSKTFLVNLKPGIPDHDTGESPGTLAVKEHWKTRPLPAAGNFASLEVRYCKESRQDVGFNPAKSIGKPNPSRLWRSRSLPKGPLDPRCQGSFTTTTALERAALAPSRYHPSRTIYRKRQCVTSTRNSAWWWLLAVWILGCCLPATTFAQTELITWLGGSASLNALTGTGNSLPAARAAPNLFFDSQLKLVYLFGGCGSTGKHGRDR